MTLTVQQEMYVTERGKECQTSLSSAPFRME